MPSPYDDPRLAEDDRIAFNLVGDRMKGRIGEIKVRDTQNGPVLTYVMVNPSVRVSGNQRTLDKAELMAGAKNLKATLMNLKPQVGDELDVELIELRPTGQPSPAKIFRVEVQGHMDTSPPTPGDIFTR